MGSVPEDLLGFKEYPRTGNPQPAQISVNSPQDNSTRRNTPLQDLIYDMNETAKVLNADSSSQRTTGIDNDQTKSLSFLSLEYYQQFFNVDTTMVLDRILRGMLPRRAPNNYLKYDIGFNPDFYGPFWIAVTLVFSIAISGNVANYLQHANDNYHWRYNFRLVSYAASVIFVYAVLVPGVLWGLIKYTLKPAEEGTEDENSTYSPSLLSLMCIYGYSLAIYIPVSILWAIQISTLQWILVVSAAISSGYALITILMPGIRNSKISVFLIFGISAVHFLLATGFMLYFFHVPSVTPAHNGLFDPSMNQTIIK